jgi:hypothetical protein
MVRHLTAGAMVLLALVTLLVAVPAVPGAAGSSTAALPPPHPGAIRPVHAVAAAGYTVAFQAPFLSTSETFHFQLDGVKYSAPAGLSVSVPTVATGLHYVTNITATPVTPGWQFFGWANPGSPIDVPDDLSVNLSFAYVNMNTSLGPKLLQAPRLPSTLAALVEFNGTTYTIPSTGLTVMIRTGAYDLRPYEVFSPNGSARYFSSTYTSNTFLVPNGTPYNVTYMVRYLFQLQPSPGGTVTQQEGSYTTAALQGWYAPGDLVTIRATGTPANAFGWWTGTGLGSYTGPEPRRQLTVLGPITEAASFVPIGPNREVIRFNGFGLPNGTIWSVFVDGHGFSSPTSTVVVPGLSPCTTGLLGAHAVSVPVAYANFTDPRLGARYVPVANYSTLMCGNNLTNIYFTSEFLVAEQSNGGGAVGLQVNGLTAVPGWVAAGTSLQLTETPYPGYRFLGWNGTGAGSYSGAATGPTVIVTGALSEAAAFSLVPVVPPTTFTITFAPSVPLPTGTVWTVSIDGSDAASSGASLAIGGLAEGDHALVIGAAISPDGRTRYTPSAPSESVNVSSDASVTLDFTIQYWLSIEVAGPGVIDMASQWVALNSTVNLTAQPGAGSALLGWTGVSANGAPLDLSFEMTGPTNVVATFGAAPPAPGIAWSAPGPVGVVAVIALAGGLAIGALLRRRDLRRRARRAETIRSHTTEGQ